MRNNGKACAEADKLRYARGRRKNPDNAGLDNLTGAF